MCYFTALREWLPRNEKLNVNKNTMRGAAATPGYSRERSFIVRRPFIAPRINISQRSRAHATDGRSAAVEYRSNLDRGQELIPAVLVDEESETHHEAS